MASFPLTVIQDGYRKKGPTRENKWEKLQYEKVMAFLQLRWRLDSNGTFRPLKTQDGKEESSFPSSWRNKASNPSEENIHGQNRKFFFYTVTDNLSSPVSCSLFLWRVRIGLHFSRIDHPSRHPRSPTINTYPFTLALWAQLLRQMHASISQRPYQHPPRPQIYTIYCYMGISGKSIQYCTFEPFITAQQILRYPM